MGALFAISLKHYSSDSNLYVSASDNRIGDFLIGLLAKSEQPDFRITFGIDAVHDVLGPLPLSAQALLYFLTESNSNLQKLSLSRFVLTEEYFQAMMADASARPDIKIELICCKIESSDGDSFLACLARGRGPTGLIYCTIEPSVLANALRESTRLKELVLGLSGRGREEEDFEMITSALANNRSLEELKFYGDGINDTAWHSPCRTLAAHPILQVLHLGISIWNARFDVWDPDFRSHDLATMMSSNTVLQVITVEPRRHYNRHIFEALVVPRLEMNRSFFAERRTALKQAAIAVHPQLLGRVLAVIRVNPTLFFKFFSENVDVVAAALGGNAPPHRGN